MSPAMTRRGLVKAGAAAIGASVAGGAAMARAGVADPDASLFEALSRYDEARAAGVATHAPHDEALDAPSRPIRHVHGC